MVRPGMDSPSIRSRMVRTSLSDWRLPLASRQLHCLQNDVYLVIRWVKILLPYLSTYGQQISSLFTD